MATRKFLFMNESEGYSQEQGPSDELSLGKITLAGVSGVALDVGGQLISNVGVPSNSTDAARKVDVENAQAAAETYADGIVLAEATARQSADTTLQTNIDNEALARQGADTTLQQNINAEATTRQNADIALQGDIDAEEARALAAEGVLQTNIDNEATARAAADTQLGLDLDAEEAARLAADQALQQNINNEATARENADNQLRADFEAADDALEADYIARDVVVLDSAKAYADSLQSGFIVKEPAKAIAVSNITLSGTQTVDGVALVAGDRVLVAGQTDATKNGIYVVAGGAWSRSSDLDTDADMKDGVSVFIEQGAQYADSTWVLITNNPIVIGSTDISFVQFSGLGQITAGLGLSKTGNTLDVNVGSGIHISADAVAVDLSATPGLQFEAGKLAAKPDAARGLAKDGSGLYVKNDETKAIHMDAAAGLQLHISEAQGLEIHGDDGLLVHIDPAKALQFNGVSGAIEVKADSNYGLSIDSTTGLRVDLAADAGLQFTAGDLNVKNDATRGLGKDANGIFVEVDETEGLVIDATEGLQVKYDPSMALAMDAAAGLQVVADANKAISVSASGVALELATDPGLQFTAGKLDHKLVSADRLVKGADGLDVTGVPSLFKIGGTAVGANVTATNLTRLTDGSSTALHSHAFVRSALLGAQALSAARCVYISGPSQLSTGSCSASATARIIGVTTAASAAGAQAVVTTHGVAAIPTGSFTVGTPYYLGSDGSLVEFSALVSGDRVIRVGYGVTAGGLQVAIQDMGAKA